MTILEQKIHNFTGSLQQSLANQNYFAALTLALTLPDICSKLENPQLNTGPRYIDWFNEFLSRKYKRQVGPQGQVHTFLSGGDFYALRCAVLHQGELDITSQRARQVLNDFIFVRPRVSSSVHLNQLNDTLQLQVDIFCVDIILAVEEWVKLHKDDAQINSRATNIMEMI